MSPRPTQDDRDRFQERILKARARRDDQVQQAEQEFWRTVSAELQAGHYGAQRDAAEALGFTRDHVRKQIQRYADHEQ